MAVAKKRETQETLPNMPTPDEVGKAAQKYIDAKNAVVEAKDEEDKAAANLVTIMRKKKRQSIRVEGVMVMLRHRDAQDIIRVKKADK